MDPDTAPGPARTTSCAAPAEPTGVVPHCKRPCPECPWRTDTTPGQFPADRYEALRGTSSAPDGSSTPMDAPIFACHKTAEGREQACAGWLAVEGDGHLGIRIAVLFGRLPGEALRPGKDWPELHGSYDEMAAAKAVDI